MSTPFQVASLVNSPTFPNAIVWSDDNLIAVATADIITILNPEHPQTPRGVITFTPGKPFPVGVIDRADLLSGCLLPICLSRDRQPCVRSLSWSPVGFTSHHGCLLAVCSAEGRVKVFRQPYCEFQAEWVEVMDISNMLHEYYAKINYGEPEAPSSAVFDDSAGQMKSKSYTAADNTNFTSRKQHKRKRDMDFNRLGEIDATNVGPLCVSGTLKAVAESVFIQSSTMQEGSSVEVFKMDGGQNVWNAGRLQRLEGPVALVQFETDSSGEPKWLKMDMASDVDNELNSPVVPKTDRDYSFPKIRPSMDIACLPEQILLAEHNEVGHFLKAGQLVEAWSRNRWLEGFFLGFSNGGLLIQFSGDAEAVTLTPTDVRLMPLWIREEKSWKVNVVRSHVQDSPEVVVKRSGLENLNYSSQPVPVTNGAMDFPKRTTANSTKKTLTAHQYFSRSSMLASLVVAWSSQLQLSTMDSKEVRDCCCLLAVGTKSGSISIWRFDRPSYYSVERGDDAVNMSFIGVIQAHDSWVTALSWGFLASDSRPRVLLASGACDGSVRIWHAHVCDLKKLSEAVQNPLSLFTEVAAGDNVLVSVISLCVPILSPWKILLAFGKGSGSFELWTCDTKVKSSHNVGSYDAHVQAVTGLVWAFDGRCLYSCSQDNSIYGWKYHKGSLSEASVPPNNLGTRSFSDLPSVSDSCYGMAISPGNLALAVARRFDAGQLDHMYQKRTQRAAVEFFWIGGQPVDLPSTVNLEIDVEGYSSFSKEELEYWGSKLLWSLKQYECHSKHLVLWDILAALLAFKPCAPWFIKHIVLRWLELLLKNYLDPSIKDILSEIPKYMPNISSRQLHLLNIFSRRLIASSGFEVVKVHAKSRALTKSYGEEEQQWMDLVLNGEKELRERLVGLSLSTALVYISDQASKAELELWNPVGVAQMVKWVVQNKDCVSCHLNHIASEIEGFKARLQSVCDYDAEEQCSFCSAAIPFESPELAFCEGVKYCDEEPAQQHKLIRCAGSMKVCPYTTVWFCMCCRRRASSLAPLQLFNMNNYPPDFLSFIKSLTSNLLPKPLCPFCGISLQRLQPDFLLSISPV